MAPERLMNRPYDGRSDIYSLGIMMYWMLTGTPPFESKEGGGFVLAMMHLTADPPSLCDRNPALPRDLATLVQRMLSRDPPARPTATELAGLIRAILPADPKRQKAQ